MTEKLDNEKITHKSKFFSNEYLTNLEITSDMKLQQ